MQLAFNTNEFRITSNLPFSRVDFNGNVHFGLIFLFYQNFHFVKYTYSHTRPDFYAKRQAFSIYLNQNAGGHEMKLPSLDFFFFLHKNKYVRVLFYYLNRELQFRVDCGVVSTVTDVYF